MAILIPLLTDVMEVEVALVLLLVDPMKTVRIQDHFAKVAAMAFTAISVMNVIFAVMVLMGRVDLVGMAIQPSVILVVILL